MRCRQVAILCLAAAGLASCATTSQQGTLAELAQVEADIEEVFLDDSLERAAQSYRRYLEETPESARTPEAMRRLADLVVPPNQAEAMVEVLRSKGIPVAYVPFEGEQHGFRRAENIVRAIEAEYLFFAKVFGIEPADSIPPLEIKNL